MTKKTNLSITKYRLTISKRHEHLRYLFFGGKSRKFIIPHYKLDKFIRTHPRLYRKYNAKTYTYYFGECLISIWLYKHHVPYVYSYSINEIKHRRGVQDYDFYLPQYNVLIEFDGLQHFKPVDFSGHHTHKQRIASFRYNLRRDHRKNVWAKRHHLRLCRIENSKNATGNDLLTLINARLHQIITKNKVVNHHVGNHVNHQLVHHLPLYLISKHIRCKQTKMIEHLRQLDQNYEWRKDNVIKHRVISYKGTSGTFARKYSTAKTMNWLIDQFMKTHDKDEIELIKSHINSVA